MASSMPPTNGDLLELIRRKYPGPKQGIKSSEYQCQAKTCLQELLQQSGMSCTESELSYTSRRFVEYVRELWKQMKDCRNFNREKSVSSVVR